MKYELISWSYSSSRSDYYIELKRHPFFIFRIFGYNPRNIYLKGSCTVWEYYPDMNRASTSIEFMMLRFWNKIRDGQFNSERIDIKVFKERAKNS